MNHDVFEGKTTSFFCPNCESKKKRGNLAIKVGDHFFCKKCGSTYKDREQANTLREELKQPNRHS